MLSSSFYHNLTEDSLNNNEISDERCLQILESPELELLSLLNAAYKVRYKYWKKEVTIHIINNVQNGLCSEDCRYCAQSKSSSAKIVTYKMKSDEQIMTEAKNAYESGAHRYCLVFSGKGPTENRINHLSSIIKKIKQQYDIEVCVSPGSLDEKGLKILKKSGLNRLNHNLNTSEKFYKEICSTHSYNKRIQTLQAASNVGLDICSGIIIGMGEESLDVIKAAKFLKSLKNVKSIPVNFLIPIKGIALKNLSSLSPEYCLKVLSLFRLINPETEIRAAAGRELHLKSLEPFCLYPANSIFMDGYLNTRGDGAMKDLNMIKDLGFTIKSNHTIDKILKKQLEKNEKTDNIKLKNSSDLHIQ